MPRLEAAHGFVVELLLLGVAHAQGLDHPLQHPVAEREQFQRLLELSVQILLPDVGCGALVFDPRTPVVDVAALLYVADEQVPTLTASDDPGEREVSFRFVADLTAEFQKDSGAWEKSIFPKALDVNRIREDTIYNVKPGIYGVPIDVTNIQMLYNKKLLARVGKRRAPKNFEEFLETTDALKRIGIGGLVSGWGEVWLINCFALNYAFNIMGEEKVINTIKGEVPYTDSDWIKVFKLFEELRNSEGLASGIVTMNNKYAEQLFSNEKVAFSFNGSWCVNVYKGMNPHLDYEVILPPEFSDKYLIKIWGGAGASFYVNVNSPLKEEAVKFLKWLTKREQQIFLVNKTLNLPSNKYALSKIPNELSQFADDSERITHPNMWPQQEYPKVIETFTKGIQAIIIKEKTPEQLALEVQQVKEKEMKKEGR